MAHKTRSHEKYILKSYNYLYSIYLNDYKLLFSYKDIAVLSYIFKKTLVNLSTNMFVIKNSKIPLKLGLKNLF